MKKSNLKAIIGIGNPESEYNDTYHNIGKLFINHLTSSLDRNIKDFKSENKYKFSYLKTGGFILAKNETYMNAAGFAVKSILSKFKLKPEEIMIAHDDSDISIGKYKISFGRSSAGHKGVENIINKIGKNFWRCRMGIRPEKERIRKKSEAFVLKKISKKDMKTFEKLFEDIEKEILKNLK